MTGWKAACRVVATTDIALVDLPEIDGVPVAAMDRVVVAGQRAAAEIGVYSAVAGPWVRAGDANSALSVSRMVVGVKNGRTASVTDWALATTDPIMLGTTAVRYVLLHR